VRYAKAFTSHTMALCCEHRILGIPIHTFGATPRPADAGPRAVSSRMLSSTRPKGSLLGVFDSLRLTVCACRSCRARGFRDPEVQRGSLGTAFLICAFASDISS